MDKVNQKFQFILPLVYKNDEMKKEKWEHAGDLTISGIALDTFGTSFLIEDIRQNGHSVRKLFDFFRATFYCSCDFIDEACAAHIVGLFDTEEDLRLSKEMGNAIMEGGDHLFNAIANLTRLQANRIINQPKPY